MFKYFRGARYGEERLQFQLSRRHQGLATILCRNFETGLGNGVIGKLLSELCYARPGSAMISAVCCPNVGAAVSLISGSAIGFRTKRISRPDPVFAVENARYSSLSSLSAILFTFSITVHGIEVASNLSHQCFVQDRIHSVAVVDTGLVCFESGIFD